MHLIYVCQFYTSNIFKSNHNLHIANCTPPILRGWISQHPQVCMRTTKPPISTNVCFIRRFWLGFQAGMVNKKSIAQVIPRMVTIAQVLPLKLKKLNCIRIHLQTNANEVVWHPSGEPFWQSPSWPPKLAS